jgi:citrate lyase beta subunit
MTIDPAELADATAALREANLAFARRYPGDRGGAQPVHTFIEGAQHFAADVAARRGAEAIAALDAYAGDAASFASAFGLSSHSSAEAIAQRVREKLMREPIEDYRIDFEDGFGVRSDADEDARVDAVAAELARGGRDGGLAASTGIRIKPLTEELRGRSLRTLARLVSALARADALPARWIVTVPKVTVIQQIDYVVAAFNALERSLGLARGTLRFEIMVEVPQAVLDAAGTSLLPRLLDASDGRLASIAFGTYDYTAACGITAAYQRLRHPACDFAKHMIQSAFAGTGVRLADGSTAFLPSPIHHGDLAHLTAAQHAENAAAVHAGWLVHVADVRHSLAGGFYQGWDLSAAQLVSRYAAVVSFYLEGIELAGARLKTFLSRAANAKLVGGMLDEPATGQGLLAFFLRGVSAGAISETHALELTGLTISELRDGSMVSILRRRGLVPSDAATGP